MGPHGNYNAHEQCNHTLLREQFPDRLMSKRGDGPWPPRPPDLTVIDFFLWGYLKHQIWNVPTQQQLSNLIELREAITYMFNMDMHAFSNE